MQIFRVQYYEQLFYNRRPMGLNGHFSVKCNAMKMEPNQISIHMYKVL